MSEPSAAAPPEDESPPSPGPRGRVMKASAWVVVGQSSISVIRLGSNLILTRLLDEEAFGLMALVNVFLVGLELLSDLGLGPAVVRHHDQEDERFINTAWSMSVIRGALLCSICWIGAYPFSLFYGEPVLGPLTMVVGVSVFISGFASTRFFETQRRLQMKEISILQICRLLVQVGTMVTLAWIYRSVWALALGSLAGSLTWVAMTHFWLHGIRNRFRWEKSAVKSLFGYGRWIFGSTMVNFFSSHSDRLIFGKLIPVNMLGVYHIGATVADIPTSSLTTLASRVLFPLTSQVKDEDDHLKRMFARSSLLFTTVAGWILCGFAAGGQTIIDLLFDDRYTEAGWMLQFLCVAGWISVLQLSVRPLLLARGDVQYLLYGNLAKLFAMLALIPLGYMQFGFPGAVAGLAGSRIGNYLVLAFALRKTGFGNSLGDLFMSLYFAAGVLAGNVAARYVDGLGAHTIVEAVVVFVVVTLFWTPRAARVAREFGGVKALLSR